MATVKLHLPDGRWLEQRPLSVNDQIAIVDLPKEFNKRIERMRFWADLFRRRNVALSWEGDPGDLTPEEMIGIVPAWIAGTEDDAVPPASGSSSATPRRSQRSPARTANGRRSSGRGSSKS